MLLIVGRENAARKTRRKQARRMCRANSLLWGLWVTLARRGMCAECHMLQCWFFEYKHTYPPVACLNAVGCHEWLSVLVYFNMECMKKLPSPISEICKLFSLGRKPLFQLQMYMIIVTVSWKCCRGTTKSQGLWSQYNELNCLSDQWSSDGTGKPRVIVGEAV